MLFGLFNSKKQTLPPADMSLLKTDMHSHLIPGIDDGVKSVQESLDLITKLKDTGFSRLITTPHIMCDFYKNNPDIINTGLDTMRFAVVEAGIDIKIDAAAEYLVDDGFEKLANKGTLMTFGDKYLLVELSYYNMFHGFFNIVFNLNVDGYKIILAHPERYGYFHDRFDIYEDIKARGVYFQLNTISLSGHYTTKVQKTAEKLIDMGMYDFAATDMHNHDYLNSFNKALCSPYLHKLIDSGKLMNHLL